MKKETLKKAFIDSLPVMAGYLVLGIGFGILLYSKGYGFFWALACSLFVYAGSLQYLMVDMIAGATSLLTVGITALMVNARHLFYGISMIDRYRDTGIKKPYLIFSLTDETYSLVCNTKDDDKQYYFLVSLFDHIYWITGSVLGSLIGSLITFSVEGIDFSLTALFVCVMVDQWLSVKDHSAALIGLSASVICLMIFGPANFLIPTMILILASMLIMKKVKEEK